MSLIDKVAAFARSPQGRKYIEQAKQYAAKPENQQKIQQLKTKVNRHGSGGGTGRSY